MKNTHLLIAMLICFGGVALADQPGVMQPPKVMIGVWYQPVSSFDTWKARGINTMVGIVIDPAIPPEDYVKAAHEAGFYVIGKDVAADAWEQPDEPDGAGATPAEKIVENYKNWKALPGGAAKPVFVNFDGWRSQYVPADNYIQYCKGADWIAYDWYILNHGDGPGAIPRIGERYEKFKEWSGGNKKIFVFIETCDSNIKVQDWAQANDATGTPLAPKMRGPTPEEMKKEVEVSMQHGASGIIYFPHVIGKWWEKFDGTPLENEAAMKEINAKLGGAPLKTLPIKPVTIPPLVPLAPTTKAAAGDAPLEGREVTIDGVTYILKRKN